MNKKNSEITLNFLEREDQNILKEIRKLKITMPSNDGLQKAGEVMAKFESLHKNRMKLSTSAISSISLEQFKASKCVRNMRLSKRNSCVVRQDKKRLRSQEIVLKKCEKRLGRSLSRMKGLWQENLSDMESSLKFQRNSLTRIRKDYFDAIKAIETEINAVLESSPVPNLNLENLNSKKVGLKKSSDRSLSHQKGSDEDYISNRSAFSIVSEDIAPLRSYRTKPSTKSNSRGAVCQDPKSTQQIGEEKLCLNSKSLKSALSGDYELEESINLKEIRTALSILKKANLLNNHGNAELLKIAEMIKDPENSSNIELILQLIDIKGQKNRKHSCSHIKTIGKPSTPAHRIKFRSKIDDFEDTSREKFKFSEEKSFCKTILSNEQLISPKNYEESFEYSLKAYQKNEELKDAKLEDLLNVTSLMDDLGLLSVENSVIFESLQSPGHEAEDSHGFYQVNSCDILRDDGKPGKSCNYID